MYHRMSHGVGIGEVRRYNRLDYIKVMSFLQQVLFKCDLLNDAARRSDDVGVKVMN